MPRRLTRFSARSPVPLRSFTADGAYDQDWVSQAVAEHDPDAAIIVPPRAGAVANAPAETICGPRSRLQSVATSAWLAIPFDHVPTKLRRPRSPSPRLP